MRQLIFIILFCVILFSVSFSLKASEDQWEQSGYIKGKTGYVTVDGNEESYLSLNGYKSGLNLLYEFEINGNYYGDEREIYYYFARNQDQSFNWEFYFQNLNFIFEKCEEIKLEFPLLITFPEGRIDGFKFKTFDNDFILFSGKETYVPLTFRAYLENTLKYNLLDNPGAGDILQFSEIVMVNGEKLLRGQDYSINYLSGELELHISMQKGSMVEVKFLYIPIDEEQGVSGQKIWGVMLTKNWQANTMNCFYFNKKIDINGKQKDYLSSYFDYNEKNDVFGMRGQFKSGPLQAKGEWALSFIEERKAAPAYDLDINLRQNSLNMNYKARYIDPGFQEIGINQYPKGGFQEFFIGYNVEDNIKFTLSHRINIQDVEKNLMKTMVTGEVDYILTDCHSFQFLTKKIEDNIGTFATNQTDMALGYIFTQNGTRISFGQFMRDLNSRYFEMRVKKFNFHVNGDYSVEKDGDENVHKLKFDFNYRPFKSITFTGLTHYEKPVSKDSGRYKILLTNLCFPMKNVSINSRYIYINNQLNQSYNQSVTIMGNYNNNDREVNLNLKVSDRETLMVKTGESMVNLTGYQKIYDNLSINYLVSSERFNEYSKFHNLVLRGEDDSGYDLKINYHLNNGWDIYLGGGYKKEIFETWGILSQEGVFKINGGVDYRFDSDHLITLNLEMEKRDDDLTGLIMSKLNYPLGTGKIDSAGNISYSFLKGEITGYFIKTDLTLPEILRITPLIKYVTDYKKNWPECHEKKEEIVLNLAYPIGKDRNLFVETKFSNIKDLRRPENNYTAREVFSGIHINF